jgi:hypothetical protein
MDGLVSGMACPAGNVFVVLAAIGTILRQRRKAPYFPPSNRKNKAWKCREQNGKAPRGCTNQIVSLTRMLQNSLVAGPELLILCFDLVPACAPESAGSTWWISRVRHRAGDGGRLFAGGAAGASRIDGGVHHDRRVMLSMARNPAHRLQRSKREQTIQPLQISSWKTLAARRLNVGIQTVEPLRATVGHLSDTANPTKAWRFIVSASHLPTVLIAGTLLAALGLCWICGWGSYVFVGLPASISSSSKTSLLRLLSLAS